MLHLVLDPQRHPGVVAGAGDEGIERRRSSPREENVRLIAESRPEDSSVALESMPSRERDHQVLRQQALADQRLARDRGPKNPDVDAPALQRRYLLRGREVAQLDFHVRMSPGEQPDDVRPVEEVSPEVAAHQDLANLAAARPLRVPGGLLGLCNERSRVAEEHAARVRQLHMTLRPLKEGRLQLLLEASDLLAQGRLGDMEPRGGPAEMQLFG